MQGARAQLSRDLVALWADEYGPALGVLRAALPPGLMRYLNQPRPAPPPLPQASVPRADGPPSGPERVVSPPPVRVLPGVVAPGGPGYIFLADGLRSYAYAMLQACASGLLSALSMYAYATTVEAASISSVAGDAACNRACRCMRLRQCFYGSPSLSS